MPRAAAHPQAAAVPPLRGHMVLGLSLCELAATAGELLAIGLPLWRGLVAGAVAKAPLRAGAVLVATLWLAGVIRMFDVARPLLAIHARRRKGEPVPPALADPARHALTHLPGDTAKLRFFSWLFVVTMVTAWAGTRGVAIASALAAAGLAIIQAAGMAALRARLFEGWLRAVRAWLLPNIDGMRIYMHVYKRRLWRAALLVLTVGHGVWLWMSFFCIGVGGPQLGMWGWPVLLVGCWAWGRSLHRRTGPVEAYFDLVYRTPSTRGPARDEPAAVAAFGVAQALPYRMAGYVTLILALTFLSAVAVGRWWLGFEADVAARLLVVAMVTVLACSGYALMLLRRTMSPLLRQLGSRHHLPLKQIRSPASLRVRLGLVFLSFGACLAGPWLVAATASPVVQGLLPGSVGFVLAVGLALLVTRDTIEPLTALESRAEEMARGELARPVSPAGEADEIGRLTVAFEEMRRALRDRLRSTESINVDLEREVRRRTDALEKRNAELAEALDKLRRAQDDLVRSEKLASMGRLVAGIAHEINNPVNAVINTLDPLGEQLEEIEQASSGPTLDRTREARDMLGVIRRGAARTKAIVRALHNYSRGEDQQFRPVDLHRVIADTLDLLRHQLRDVEVSVDVPSPCEVMAIPGQIDQVVMNLIVNAAQALGSKGGHITIAARQQVDEWHVTVADDGPGIPTEVLPKIFDPFFTTKGVGEGAGLGLSIVHGIVERHKGRISVASTGATGTTFSLQLPLAFPEAAVERHA